MEGQPRQVKQRREPAQPLEQLSPKPSHYQRSVGRKLLHVFGVALMLLVCGTLAFGIYLLSLAAKISDNPWSLSPLTSDINRRTNVLVLGMGDPGHSGEKLTDSVMMLSLSQSHEQIAQISLPRDLRVQIPDYGSRKLNSAYALGGVDLANSVVSTTTNQTINYTITTNFTGLRTIVDVAGGLEINVQERLTDPEYPCDDDQYRVCGLDMLPGLQHMNGSQVLAYARCRKGTCGNDFGRAARQQEVVSLLRAQIMRPEVLLNPQRLSVLAGTLHQFVNTDMSFLGMMQFAQRWSSYSEKHTTKQLVLSNKPDGLLRNLPGTSDLVPVAGDFTAVQRRIADIFIN